MARTNPPAADTYAHQTEQARRYADRASSLAIVEHVTIMGDRYEDVSRDAVAWAYLAQRATEKALGVRP